MLSSMVRQGSSDGFWNAMSTIDKSWVLAPEAKPRGASSCSLAVNEILPGILYVALAAQRHCRIEFLADDFQRCGNTLLAASA